MNERLGFGHVCRLHLRAVPINGPDTAAWYGAPAPSKSHNQVLSRRCERSYGSTANCRSPSLSSSSAKAKSITARTRITSR